MSDQPTGAQHLIQHLQQENQRLQQVVLQQQQILHQRGEPLAMAVLDSVVRWCEMAEAPGHPAQAVAAGLCEKWAAATDRARAAAAGLIVAHKLPRNGNGSQ